MKKMAGARRLFCGEGWFFKRDKRDRPKTTAELTSLFHCVKLIKFAVPGFVRELSCSLRLWEYLKPIGFSKDMSRRLERFMGNT